MRHVEIDVADLMVVGLRHHNDFLGALDDEDRLKSALEQEAGNAARPAALPRTETGLSGENLFVVLAQCLPHPGLKDGIGKVGYGKCRLPSREAEFVVVDRRMSRIIGDGTCAAYGWLQPA